MGAPGYPEFITSMVPADVSPLEVSDARRALGSKLATA
jgi:hypothetical protein